MSERLISEHVRYAWLDEDGVQMSPTHERLRSALNFVNGWNARWRRVQGHEHHEREATRTGKPPVSLRRIVVRSYAVDLTDAEREVVQTYLSDIAAEDSL